MTKLLVILTLSLAVGVGTWAGLNQFGKWRTEQRAQELYRASQLLGEHERQQAAAERAAAERAVRIDQITKRLESLRSSQAKTFRVRKQFGTEGSKGVYESYRGSERCVLITDQDFTVGSIFTDITRKVAKRGRERFAWTTTYANGTQNEEAIFVDVYESFSDSEIATIEQQLIELQKQTNQ